MEQYIGLNTGVNSIISTEICEEVTFYKRTESSVSSFKTVSSDLSYDTPEEPFPSLSEVRFGQVSPIKEVHLSCDNGIEFNNETDTKPEYNKSWHKSDIIESQDNKCNEKETFCRKWSPFDSNQFDVDSEIIETAQIHREEMIHDSNTDQTQVQDISVNAGMVDGMADNITHQIKDDIPVLNSITQIKSPDAHTNNDSYNVDVIDWKDAVEDTHIVAENTDNKGDEMSIYLNKLDSGIKCETNDGNSANTFVDKQVCLDIKYTTQPEDAETNYSETRYHNNEEEIQLEADANQDNTKQDKHMDAQSKYMILNGSEANVGKLDNCNTKEDIEMYRERGVSLDRHIDDSDDIDIYNTNQENCPDTIMYGVNDFNNENCQLTKYSIYEETHGNLKNENQVIKVEEVDDEFTTSKISNTIENHNSEDLLDDEFTRVGQKLMARVEENANLYPKVNANRETDMDVEESLKGETPMRQNGSLNESKHLETYSVNIPTLQVGHLTNETQKFHEHTDNGWPPLCTQIETNGFAKNGNTLKRDAQKEKGRNKNSIGFGDRSNGDVYPRLDQDVYEATLLTEKEGNTKITPSLQKLPYVIEVPLGMRPGCGLALDIRTWINVTSFTITGLSHKQQQEESKGFALETNFPSDTQRRMDFCELPIENELHRTTIEGPLAIDMGERMEIILTFYKNEIQMYLNDEHFEDFEHNADLGSIRYLTIDGDIDLYYASFGQGRKNLTSSIRKVSAPLKADGCCDCCTIL